MHAEKENQYHRKNTCNKTGIISQTMFKNVDGAMAFNAHYTEENLFPRLYITFLIKELHD
jgi:hypothetical protein